MSFKIYELIQILKKCLFPSTKEVSDTIYFTEQLIIFIIILNSTLQVQYTFMKYDAVMRNLKKKINNYETYYEAEKTELKLMQFNTWKIVL